MSLLYSHVVLLELEWVIPCSIAAEAEAFLQVFFVFVVVVVEVVL